MRLGRRLRLAAFAVPLLLAGCAMLASPGGHPLEERIWDPAAKAFVTVDDALDRLSAPGIVLLGETHDNPRHHEIQLRVLERIAARGGTAALAFEQIDVERQPALDALREGDGAAVGIAGAVDKGWSWPRYQRLASFARERGWRIVATNLSRDRARDVARKGFDALGAGEVARLALDRTDSPARRKAMRDDLVAGHCGQDGPMMDALVNAQRARDAVIADHLLAAGRPTVAAILGRGHARRDLAVPLYLAQRAPQARVVSLGLVEIDEGRTPADYPEAAPGVHDLVWFTSRASREDPCKDFKGVKPQPVKAASSADARQLVTLPEPMRLHTIASMRDHLLALQEINVALSKDDFATAAQVAERRLGMSSLESHGASHIAPFMPKGMQDIGTEMHRAASRFTVAAENAGVSNDVRPALAALGDVMRQCVACHAAYRLH